MSNQHFTPVVIGVGDIVNREISPEDAREPLDLMLEAITNAIKDTGLSPTDQHILQTSIDSIDVVRTWTWPYTNLPDLLAKGLKVEPKHMYCSDHGGNQPVKLFDESARRIAKGQNQLAIVVGGEALASCKCGLTCLSNSHTEP